MGGQTGYGYPMYGSGGGAQMGVWGPNPPIQGQQNRPLPTGPMPPIQWNGGDRPLPTAPQGPWQPPVSETGRGMPNLQSSYDVPSQGGGLLGMAQNVGTGGVNPFVQRRFPMGLRNF